MTTNIAATINNVSSSANGFANSDPLNFAAPSSTAQPSKSYLVQNLLLEVFSLSNVSKNMFNEDKELEKNPGNTNSKPMVAGTLQGAQDDDDSDEF